ncbi:anti-sigma factor [Mycolicibacterium boenickei]|nr:anti-sigma factor [Mycolicibacterium boenickei]
MPHWRPGHTRGPRAVELRVPARTDALSVVRAMTCCLADYEELDSDTAADLTLAVDEACTVLIGMASAGAALVLIEDPRVRELSVRVSTVCDSVHSDPGSTLLSGFSRRVLEALTDRVDTFVDDVDVEHPRGPRPALGISLTIWRHGAPARR